MPHRRFHLRIERDSQVSHPPVEVVFVRGDLGVLGEEIGVHAGEEGALLVGLDVELALGVNVSENQVGKEKKTVIVGGRGKYTERDPSIFLYLIFPLNLLVSGKRGGAHDPLTTV